ncbi:aminoglycoside phosphotransferase family protein [Thermodesulfatator indicus]
MSEVVDYLRIKGISYDQIIPLTGDGSARNFYRLLRKNDSLILICPQPGKFGLKESRSYVKIGEFLRENGLPVPAIYDYDEARGFILVEDLGDIRLEDLTKEKRFSLFPQVFEILAQLREIKPAFPREYVLDTLFYDETLMWEKEALYFQDSFVKGYMGLDDEEIEPLLRGLWEKAKRYVNFSSLLHRDFQSRNLMVKNGTIWMIDFQGMRIGPTAYDLASFLIDPYQGLTFEEISIWLSKFQNGFPGLVTEKAFWALALFRNFQALGAFAKLSREGKTWFSRYIPIALASLRKLLNCFPPEGEELAKKLVKN